jgi:hypothetical protein
MLIAERLSSGTLGRRLVIASDRRQVELPETARQGLMHV